VDGSLFEPRHFFGVGLKVRSPYLFQTSWTIGVKNDSKYFRNEIVECIAFGRVRIHQALGAGGDPFFIRAFLDLTPGIVFAFLAAFTFFLQVGTAGSAIKPATGYQGRVRFHLTHGKHPLLRMEPF
jgi:hypothetical protein